MAADTQFDFNEEFRRMNDRLTAAMESFRAASDSYTKSGDALDLAVTKQLANYYDPANHRAALIQEAARELSTEITQFKETFINLGMRYGFSVIQAQQVVLALSREMATRAVSALIVDEEDPRVVAHALMENLSGIQKKNALLMARGIVVGERLATAVQVAAYLLQLREAEFKGYLAEVPPAEVHSIKVLLSEAVANEGALTVCERLLGEMAQAIGTSIPIASIVVSIARIALDLRGKIRSLQPRYERGDVDLMLELREEIQVGREAVEDASKLFDKIFSLSTAQLELTA